MERITMAFSVGSRSGAIPMKDYDPPEVETHGSVEELTQDMHYGES